MKEYRLTDWLPTTRKEVELRGWNELDVVLFSINTYVDHPSFGAAVIGRILGAEGLKIAIIPQPDWHDDLRDFKELGRPRLFFGVSGGYMDSIVNKYTTNKRLRSENAYTPDDRPDMRPDYPSTVYNQILKKLFPDVPIVTEGIETSLGRLSHYDYWQDKVQKGILCGSGADLLIYGMGEEPLADLVKNVKSLLTTKEPVSTNSRFRTIIGSAPQTAYLCRATEWTSAEDDLQLYSHEECLADRKKQASNFRHIEEKSNKYSASRIIQAVGDKIVVVNPPYPLMSQKDLGHSFDLPYTRLPRPKYKGKRIPAHDMIRFSINIHRGCFGGCAFCTISTHQGKFIVSRSKESILKEVEEVIQLPDFKGYLSGLGGPSANMYQMKRKDEAIYKKYKRPSRIHPKVYPNLNTDHRPLLGIYHAVDTLPGIRKPLIDNGVRYDLLPHRNKDKTTDRSTAKYTRELIVNRVSGRLKIAPEHASDRVLSIMCKPSFEQFETSGKIFGRINWEENLRRQLVPHFISSHPKCNKEDMTGLAVITKRPDLHLEQVQDFTPTPMTVATEAWYSGFHPYTLEPIFNAKAQRKKLA